MQSIIGNRYLIIKQIGSGGFGKTFLAEDTHLPSRRKCVVKQLSLDPNLTTEERNSRVDRFHQEAKILERLGTGSTQIPALFAFFTDSNEFYIVQEWIDGDVLSSKIVNKQSEDFVKNLMISLLNVLNYVHSENIIHRDINLNNIIIRYEDNNPVLLDFGIIKEIVGDSASTTIPIGTPYYIPLEQIGGHPVLQSDIYSLSITMICLLCGKKPFDIYDPTHKYTNWVNYCQNISNELKSILNRGIQTNYQNRYANTQEMLQDLHKSNPIKIPDSAKELYYEGLDLLVKKNVDQAIDKCKEAIKIKSDYSEAYYCLGMCYLNKQKYIEAILEFSNAINFNSDYVDAFEFRGTAYERIGALDRAKIDFEQALALQPNNSHSLKNLAEIHKKNGKYVEALKIYGQLILLKPEDATVYSARAYIYYLTKEMDKALMDYNQSISLNPRIDNNYYWRGRIYFQKGYFHKAITDFTEAIKLNPIDSSAYYNRGLCYMKIANSPNFIKDLKKALELSKDDKDSQEIYKTALDKFGISI